MSGGHRHSATGASQERALWWALGLTTTFLIAELIGAYVTKSLALLSDAAHMLTDVAALGTSLAAIRIGSRGADRKRTFGYYRLEILAAALNASLLFIVAMYILYEAIGRFKSPEPVQSTLMLVIASIGLAVNLVSMRLLRAGSEGSLNVKGAYLEVWSDLLGSIGVIAAALLIKWTGYLWIDSVIAAGIGLWVLPRTWTLLKASVNILMQGVPEGVDLEKIELALRAIPGVRQIHDLHVWSITSGRNVLTVHVNADFLETSVDEVLQKVNAAVRQFGIDHATVQVEGLDAAREGCSSAH